MSKYMIILSNSNLRLSCMAHSMATVFNGRIYHSATTPYIVETEDAMYMFKIYFNTCLEGVLEGVYIDEILVDTELKKTLSLEDSMEISMAAHTMGAQIEVLDLAYIAQVLDKIDAITDLSIVSYDDEDDGFAKWSKQQTTSKVEPIKCNCGAAKVGGIPHYEWCAIYHLEKTAPPLPRD